MRCDALRDVPIDFVLFLLGRERGPVQIKKLRPVKPDPFRAVLQHRLDIRRHFNISRQNDVAAIARGRFRFAQFAELLRHPLLAMFQFAVMPKRIRRRIQNQNAVVAIEQDFLPALQLLRRIVQTDDRRNPHRSRHDRGVRSAATEVGRKREHPRAIHRRRVRGRNVMRHQNVLLVRPEIRLRRLALEI